MGGYGNEAVVKWFDVLHRLENLEDDEGLTEKEAQAVRGRFEKDLDFEIEHSFKAWSLTPSVHRRRTHWRGPSKRDRDRDLVFLKYSQHLDEELFVETGVDELPEADIEDVVFALRHYDIDSNGIDAHGCEVFVDWEFTIDVDDVAENLDNLVRDEKPDVDDDDEDDA